MKKLILDIRFRIAVVVALALIGVWLLLPHEARQWAINGLELFAALAGGPVVIGAAWGWLKLDAGAGLKAASVTGVFVVGIVGLVVGKDLFTVNGAYKKSDAGASLPGALAKEHCQGPCGKVLGANGKPDWSGTYY